jgi:hypothetical protein
MAKRLIIYLFTLGSMCIQSCTIESATHEKVFRQGWNTDPMNPKYARKKYSDKPLSAQLAHKYSGNQIIKK